MLPMNTCGGGSNRASAQPSAHSTSQMLANSPMLRMAQPIRATQGGAVGLRQTGAAAVRSATDIYADLRCSFPYKSGFSAITCSSSVQSIASRPGFFLM